MSSIRALMCEAAVCLDRSVSTNQPVVREIMLTKAAKLIARAEVMVGIGVEEFPLPFVDAILAQRATGSTEPVVVVRCPEMTREEFLEWRRGNPSQFAGTVPDVPAEVGNSRTKLHGAVPTT